jgi:poly(3-hydroxybutyrate) depolymerase
VLGIHGSDDPIIPYTGYPDAKEPPAAYYAINVPIPQWAASWARRNDCDTQSVSAVQSDEVTRDQWNNCRGDADVVLYTIKGGGHEWTDTIELAQVIWEFFAEHSR